MPKARSLIAFPEHSPRLEEIDPDRSCSREEYEERLEKLQYQLLKIQQAYYHQKRRAIIVFEGWDASGKGGTIRRLLEKLDPRGYKVYPIAAPSPEEQGRHYLYRFFIRLPEPGTIAVFDRSWYGRVLVERVEGLASKAAWQRAYDEINEFERWLIDDGVSIVKLFLHIDADEQLNRFLERLNNPLKQWKLTAEDLRNRQQRAAYEKAIDDMFRRTSTISCPWEIIPANRKWYARTAAMQKIVDHLSQGVDLSSPVLDEEVIKAARIQLGVERAKK